VVDFNKVVAGQERGGAFVTDDRSFANIILGPYQKPQPGNKGHYHEEGGEFWLIMLGKIRYNIEGLQEFEAEPGGRRLRPAADVAPGELRRAGRAAVVPSGDERLPVSGTHVRGGLMRLATACVSTLLLAGCSAPAPAEKPAEAPAATPRRAGCRARPAR
jgi:hypothetical protein